MPSGVRLYAVGLQYAVNKMEGQNVGL